MSENKEPFLNKANLEILIVAVIAGITLTAMGIAMGYLFNWVVGYFVLKVIGIFSVGFLVGFPAIRYFEWKGLI